jgi:AcrR family transcriptional regulator
MFGWYTNQGEAPMSPAEIAVRERLLAAAIALIREHGPAGLTQPRVAKAAGISQSHLTYYFPTREALRNAVLERAALGQLAGIKRAFAAQADADALAKILETALGQAENSRLLVSFLLAADQDSAARKIFHDLVNSMRSEIAAAASSSSACGPVPISPRRASSSTSRPSSVPRSAISSIGHSCGAWSSAASTRSCRASRRTSRSPGHSKIS